MLSAENDGVSVEASMTEKNEEPEERKDKVESREQDGPKKDEKHGKKETPLYEDEVRDGMHVNRSWWYIDHLQIITLSCTSFYQYVWQKKPHP